MKKIINKMMSLIFALVLLNFIGINKIYASSFSVSASATSLNLGQSTTITISGVDTIGRFNISSSDSNVTSLSDTSIWIENGNASVTVSGISAGSSTITVSPADVSDSKGNKINLESRSVNITVKADESRNNTTNNNSTNNTKSSNSNSQKSASSNANLKNLVIDQEGLTPMFSSVVTSYSLTVPEKVTKLNITPTMEQAGAKYWITGDEDLQMGKNIVTITVTAPDGTKKTYTIYVDRVQDTTKADASLKNLIIDGVELNPEFTPETLEYTLGQFDSSVEKLTILAYANSDNAKVEIQGNENFKDGENIIKIIVTAEDGTTTREYTLKFNRDAKVIKTEESNSYQNVYEEPTKWENFKHNVKENKLLLIVLAVTIIELIEILVLYKKLYSKDKEEKQGIDDFNSNYNINIDGILDDKENTKKRRRGSKTEKASDTSENEENVESKSNDESKETKENEELKSNDIDEHAKGKIIKFSENLEPKDIEEKSDDEAAPLNEEKVEEKEEPKEPELEENSEGEKEIAEEETQIEELNETENIKENTENDNIKEDTKVEDNKKDELPEIDFESLIKETLKKYEEEDNNNE